MSVILLIIFFVVYIGYMDNRNNNAINNYDMNKVDTLKITMDRDKPLRVREQNLLAGKYDFKPGENNWKEHKRM